MVAKAQRRQEVLKFAAEHAICEQYALLVVTGEWMLEHAKQKNEIEELRKEKLRIREAKEVRSEAILNGWVEQKADLVRLTPCGPLPGHLLQVDKFEWLWDD